MAHLPQDQLPSQFDVVVDGSGLVQSIVASALSRAGKAVLHIDGNLYYGEQWASLMHRELQEWIAEHKGQSHDQSRDQGATPPPTVPSDGETIIEVQRPDQQARISNLVETVHSTAQEEEEPESAVTTEGGERGEGGGAVGDEASEREEGESGGGEEVEESGGGEEVGESGGGEEVEESGGGEEVEESGGGEEVEESATEQPPVTWDSLGDRRRRFNYDIMPKLMYCRGEMVHLLTRSSVSRYVEFKAVNKIYTRLNGKTEQVPCSRADVFSSKTVSMLEKRKMMKFLTFCAEFQNHPEEYQEFLSLTFVEFLRCKELPPNLIQYIAYSIAQANEQTSTLEGLEATQTFLNSLGRFGNAPFLYPIFGVGELPQGFCRFCAVYGGVYCLRRYVKSVVVSSADSKVTGIICSTGQKIACSTVVCSAALLKDSFNFGESVRTSQLSRAVLIADGPMTGVEGSPTLLSLPPGSLGPEQSVPVRLLQLDSSTNSTVESVYMVHVVCQSVNATAQQDLDKVVRAFFKIEDQADSNSSGPRLLWSLYFNMSVSAVDCESMRSVGLPQGVLATSDPDGTVAYENAVKEAEKIFKMICPEEEFHPQPPDPEDIVYEDNPGDNDTNEGDSPTIPEDGTAEEKAEEKEKEEKEDEKVEEKMEEKAEEKEKDEKEEKEDEKGLEEDQDHTSP